jgi:hypothetical protein
MRYKGTLGNRCSTKRSRPTILCCGRAGPPRRLMESRVRPRISPGQTLGVGWPVRPVLAWQDDAAARPTRVRFPASGRRAACDRASPIYPDAGVPSPRAGDPRGVAAPMEQDMPELKLTFRLIAHPSVCFTAHHHCKETKGLDNSAAAPRRTFQWLIAITS